MPKAEESDITSGFGVTLPRSCSSPPKFYTELQMNPKSRAAIMVGTAVALTIPYIAFVLYFSLKFPPNHWPAWFGNVLLVWFLANFVVVYLVGRKMAKKQLPTNGESQIQSRKPSAGVWILRIVGSYLVIIWTVLFLHGVKGTVQGEYPLVRAIPADAFLLFFILVFGWGIYRSFRPKA